MFLGLRGEKLVPPKRMRECLDMRVGDYDAVAGKSSNEGFVREKGEIEPYTGAIAIPTIEKLFPGLAPDRCRDSRQQSRWKPGSDSDLGAGESRLKAAYRGVEAVWAAGNREVSGPAAVNEWLAGIREAFWPGLRGAGYDRVDIPGSGLFWIRPTKVTLINVPYTSQKKHEVHFVVDLAIYDANILGLAHGGQPQAVAYHWVIQKIASTSTMPIARLKRRTSSLPKKCAMNADESRRHSEHRGEPNNDLPLQCRQEP